MPSTTNKRIRTLTEHALVLSNNDIVRAVEILRDWTGFSFDAAFTAIDEVAVIDDAQPPDCDAPAGRDSEKESL